MMNEKGYNAENLQALATFLAYSPQPIQFDMLKYSEYGAGDNFKSRWHRNCGSIGCAVGLATLIWPKPLRMDFTTYSQKMFFAKSHQKVNDQWWWAFAPEWSRIDNTPVGAAKRIQYFLDHGGVLPRDWGYNTRSAHLYQDTVVKRDVADRCERSTQAVQNVEQGQQSKTIISDFLNKLAREPRQPIQQKLTHPTT